MIGKYVLIRTYSAGVHIGTLIARSGKEVTLSDARRVWYWDGAATLSELATAGTSRPENCKVPAPVAEMILTEAIEIIAVTDEARINIEAIPAWSAR
jgi:hypothetical protein